MFFKKLFTPTRSADNFKDAITEYGGRSILFLPFFKGINTLNVEQLDCEKIRNIKDVYIPKTIYNDGNNGNFLIELYKRCEGLENIFVEEGSAFENYCLGKLLNNQNEDERVDGIYEINRENIDRVIIFENFTQETSQDIFNFFYNYTDNNNNNDVNTIDNKIANGLIKNGEVIIDENSPIKTVEESAFLNNKNIKKFKVTSITTIKDNAFRNCENLEIIDISQVTEFGNNIFEGCNSLKRINVGSKEICNNLCSTSLDPEQIKKVLNGELKLCYQNTDFDIEIINDRIAVALINDNGEVIIPENSAIETIGESAFLDNKNIKKFEATGITTIKDNAFCNCENLEIIDISQVTEFGNNIFEGCNSLKRINVGSKKICNNLCSTLLDTEQIKKVLNGKLKLCYQNTDFDIEIINNRIAVALINDNGEVIIPKDSKIETIGRSAFLNNDNIRKIEAPSIETIEEGAFCGCENLTDVILPKVNSVSCNMFDECNNLTKIVLSNLSTCKNLIRLSLRNNDYKDRISRNELNIYYGVNITYKYMPTKEDENGKIRWDI